jgi:FKBP-type peptidyl-prolyl cis-trans isomerase
MKLYTTLLCTTIFLAMGCTDETCYEEKGLVTMAQYLMDNNIEPELDATGLQYIILEPGGEEKPDANADVVVNYSGKQTNEEVFDMSNAPIRFNLRRLIPGWQIGIRLIGAGGSIRLFVPSNLAYGPRGQGGICGNSDLIFDIDLVSFTD